ncbi:MAG: hypothetical protein L6Q26_08785 [Anaerolineales bacterium]|nr:hypothetical protein [Anaerolineales bacterium]NUQ84027.1 hypothetical protein [Anaerolineales bacterium]
MESDRAFLAILAILLLVVISNAVVFAVVRGMTRGGEARWMEALRKSLSKPLEGSANKSMDELRKRVEELEEKKNE